MKVIIDTNVIIDVLEHRDEFFADSYAVLQLAAHGKLEGFVSAGAISDIYYIIRKSLGNAGKSREAVMGLLELVELCDTASSDIMSALLLRIADFEDAILAATAKRENADFIITRNERDFTNSPVRAVSPSVFLKDLL
jgi:predicted nucleic acid-binding protein